MAKTKLQPTDGLGPKEVKQIRQALRMVWHRSYAKKLVLKRCALPGDYFKCEVCKKRVPKIQVDHTVKCGDIDDGIIARMWCPSSGLVGMCKNCHREKTNAERREDTKRKRAEKQKAKKYEF